MMVLTGRLTYMTILEIIGIVDMKQQVANGQGVFSVGLELRKINSVL